MAVRYNVQPPPPLKNTSYANNCFFPSDMMEIKDLKMGAKYTDIILENIEI